ncbi:MMPL family transporter [Williamsia deligens]|uniref:MMPL family transporter n=1 Tax=Williamsia deligens TaxID=321325 RepID=A0ABW3GBU3_9NOCA|nr:MMPL family transporter [Williamsia deligens]MCP2195632.1 putative drug exporter of the RND superfamily [Williamsia deligens]
MNALADLVVARRRWVVVAWILLAALGGFGASQAVSALSYDFSLPGQPGFETNSDIVATFGSGGANPPVLLAVGDSSRPATDAAGRAVADAAHDAVPGARIASFADESALRARTGSVGVVMVYPPPSTGPDRYGKALPALAAVAAGSSGRLGVPVALTGADALTAAGAGGGIDILAETIFGGVGALVVLALVFGSFLAVMPIVVAAASILTTFLILWGLTAVTDVSFIVQYLLALIGLGVAIDYSLLIVTRWREARGDGLDDVAAVRFAIVTAGRSVLFSGLTVAVSLAALIALPVPFLRSIGFTGLLIPLISVATSLTLLPALLVLAGRRLEWPHRRTTSPDSRLWRVVGTAVVRRRWLAAIAATAVLVALAAPLSGLNLADPTNDSLASRGGPAATAFTAIRDSGLGQGITAPVEVVTTSPQQLETALRPVPGVAAVIAPAQWTRGEQHVVDVWTRDDVSTSAGAQVAADVRSAAQRTGASVGGLAAQNDDFISAVYGNAWWIIGLIVLVTFALLARALRSVILPLKALLLNVISLAAAYGITVFIWQDGFLTEVLFGQEPSGSITVWIPIAVFAFLFGLSMDYEVFLLGRIREEYDAGADTDSATVTGVTRTGRLVTSAALILFLAFISLSRVPATDVKILATALALGIIIDATIVRGVLAPALVAGFGRANWWAPWSHTARVTAVDQTDASEPEGRHRQGSGKVDFEQWRDTTGDVVPGGDQTS